MQRTFRELREDVEAKKAAASFDREGKTHLTFFVLLQLFLDKNLRTCDIAERAGIDAISMSKLYRDWFAEFVGFSSASEREQFIKWYAAPLIRSARLITASHRLSCEFPKYEIRRQHRKAFATKFALIGGRFCSLRELTRVRHMSKNCKQFYGHTTVNRELLEVFDFVCIYFNVEGYPKRWYVLPSALLREKKLNDGHRDEARLVIPALPRGAFSREVVAVNYEHYENAWHLFTDSEELRTTA